MYSNRMYVFSSDLASVETTAEDLSDEVTINKFDDVDYTPRKVDLYEQGTSFTAVSASEAGGNTTTCGSDIPQLATDCQGWSTPKAGYVAYFFITCGSSTRVSWDPYYFTPGSGTEFNFPGHANATSTSFAIRSYVCDGQDQSIRPSWTLLGFFPTTCSSVAALSYDDNICQPTPDPTNSPSVCFASRIRSFWSIKLLLKKLICFLSCISIHHRHHLPPKVLPLHQRYVIFGYASLAFCSN